MYYVTECALCRTHVYMCGDMCICIHLSVWEYTGIHILVCIYTCIRNEVQDDALYARCHHVLYLGLGCILLYRAACKRILVCCMCFVLCILVPLGHTTPNHFLWQNILLNYVLL